MKIDAICLADSINAYTSDRITTFEVYLPKVLLAEMNTHKELSRNYSSSRAIPSAKFVQIDHFEPLYWGQNQSGMVAKSSEISDENKQAAKEIWENVIENCKEATEQLSELGLHKQWANRPCDWHNMAKGVVTATEWKNSIWLRNAYDAQPEIKALFEQIEDYLKYNTPKILYAGEYHLPYIATTRDENYVLRYYDQQNKEISLQDAILISAAACAATSYRTENMTLAKAKNIYEKLFSGERPHYSPTEHIATPIPKYSKEAMELLGLLKSTKGISHINKNLELCSGNLKGFIQYRKVLEQSN